MEFLNRKYPEYANDDLLSSFVITDVKRFKMLIYNVVDAIKTVNLSSRLTPDPRDEIFEIYKKECTVYDLEDFVLLLSSKNSSNVSFLKRIILKFLDGYSDADFINYLREKIGTSRANKFFRLLYFFVFSKKTQINHIMKIENVDIWKVEHIYEIKKAFFEIDSEEKLLFHGTTPLCVYSILRRSFVSMSGTSLMTSGSSFGNGIYMSDDINLSLSYTNYSECESPWRYVFVSRVKNLKNKAVNIYVQNSEDILICGMICLPKDSNMNVSNIQKILKCIDEKTKFKPLLTDVETVKSSLKNIDLLTMQITTDPISDLKIMQTKRIQKEISKIMNLKTRSDIINRINFLNPQDITSPLLIELKPCKDSQLYKQCKRLKIPGIVIVFYFNTQYPFTPPSVRVVKPIFERSTGRVSEGGSLCINSLFESGWSAALNIEILCISIIDVISNESQEINNSRKVYSIPGGVIDESKLNEEYTYDHSNIGRHNISINHGWK